jgi:FKBP-type peptidyl-prolyl cis-trans isomerase
MKFATIAALGLGLTVAQMGLAQETKTATKKAAADVPAPAEAAGDSKDILAKVSYGLGLGLGRQLKSQSVDVDTELYLKGFKDGLSGGKSLYTEAQIRDAMTTFEKQMIAKLQADAKVAGEKGKKEGEAFLAANAKKAGVKATKSGLQYKVVKEGTGKVPKATDTVKTNYKGMLIDGTVFDSSEANGGPASFPVNRVIKGWSEALQLMKVGSKYTLYIPSDLAYGPTGSPPDIPPNSTLIFDIELLGIE